MGGGDEGGIIITAATNFLIGPVYFCGGLPQPATKRMRMDENNGVV